MNENIKRGEEWACLWRIPIFRFPGVEREDGVFSSCFGTCCLYFEGGDGGVVGCKVATLGMMLLVMVVVLAGELSLAMASSVWGFARVRFSKIK